MTTEAINWPAELGKKGWGRDWGGFATTLSTENEDNVLVYDVLRNRWYIIVDHGCYYSKIVYIPGPQTVEELDLLVRMLGGKK